MKLTKLFLGLFFFTQTLLAADLTFNQFRDRFQLKGEMFYMDPTGKKILRTGMVRSSRMRRSSEGATIETKWGSNANDPDGIAIHSLWTLRPDGSVHYLVEEFGGEVEKPRSGGEMEIEFVNLLKKEEGVLENFSALTWISQRKNSKERVIIRFTPVILDEEEPKPISETPIAGTDLIVSDNEGQIWATGVSVQGKYFGMKTHKGALYLSYYKFPGSQEIGVASGKSIELKIGANKSVTLKSETDFLPSGMRAIVYGFYRPGVRTARWSSVQTSTTNKEDTFLKGIGK